MLNLNEYELRDEEQRGGFNPGTPDDETFHLESINEYPGDLPDYSDLEKEEKVSLEEQLDLKEKESISETEEEQTTMDESKNEDENKDDIEESEKNQDETDDETKDESDNLEKEDSESENVDEQTASEDEKKQETLDEDLVKTDEDAQQQDEDDTVDNSEDAEQDEKTEDTSEESEEDSESVWNLFDKEEQEKVQEKALIDVEQEEEDDIDEITENEPESDKKEETKIEETKVQDEPESDEDIELDEDFKKKIEEDLEKSKDKTQKEDEGDSSISEDTDEFEETGHEDAEEIDISKIDAEHPSSYNEADNNSKMAEDLEVKIKQDIKEEEVDETKVDEDKKEKSEKPQETKEKKKKGILFYVAASLIVLLFATLLYDWGVNRNAFKDMIGIFVGSKEDTAKQIQHISKDDKEKVKNLDITKVKKDSIKIDEDTIKIIEQLPALTETEKLDSIPKADKEILPEKNKEKSIVAKTVKKRKKYRRSRRTLTPSKDFLSPNNTTDKQFPVKQTSKNAEEKVYTVQVYATPSKKDADAWVKKLMKRKIKNVFISTYTKRGVVWYRIRFGSFKSMTEAMNQAKKLGFSQTWIDRIK